MKISINADIVGLQISMDDAALVQIIKSVENLINYVADIVAFQSLSPDYIIQIILHYVHHKV